MLQALIDFCVLSSVAILFLVGCMLFSQSLSQAVLRRLPLLSFLAPRPQIPNRSSPARAGALQSLTRTLHTARSPMFSKAVVNHELSAAQKAASAHNTFSSSPVQSELKASPFTSARNGSRPLSCTSANVVKNSSRASVNAVAPALAGFPSSRTGLKRSASHLTQALGSQDGFEDNLYPHIDLTQEESEPLGRTSAKRSKGSSGDNVFFDENDFDSDVDLDVEEPSKPTTVKYPSFANPVTRAFVSPVVAKGSQSGFHSAAGRFAATPSTSHRLGSDATLPWSSSPLEHFQKPNISQFIYQAPALAAEEVDSKPKPNTSKRRTLPWLEEQAAEEAQRTQQLEAVGNRKPKVRKAAALDSSTPQAKEPMYIFNTTASAVKEQQKKLREANKKPAKVVATNDANMKPLNARKSKRVARVFLSEEQQHVLHLVTDQSKSVFFTGSAGTGKSVLLREIISAFRKKYSREPDRVAVTASTGLAACNVGGVTLHSFAGIGLGKENAEELVKKIRRNQKARHRWLRTKVLIIDEISMVDAELFDKLEEVARRLRNNGRPFGGIQLVITGDFFQLPPVPDGPKRETRFCFDANNWNTVIDHTIGLHHVFRQKDPVFAGMLNEMREGRLSSESIAKFRTLSRDLDFEDDLEATELFPTRNEVEKANQSRLQHLRGEVQTFEARDGGSIADKGLRDKLLQNCMAPEKIVLKKGAQVMLIKNVDETLVNGSLGKVIGFMSEAMFDNYSQHEEDYYAKQAAGEEDGGPSALNEKRAKLEGQLGITSQFYPVVRFAIADGSTRDLLCTRENWKVELPNGEVQASRAQVPLILAWALSIHKAQGQTLERVKVDLGKVFEKGQAYVALSRATSMAGLQVTRFDPSKVVAHDRVRSFYSKLSRAEAQGAGGDMKPDKNRQKGVSATGYERTFVEDEWEM